MNPTVKSILTVVFLVLAAGLLLIVVFTHSNADAYNKHVCATYGYQADCHTPLSADERLK